MAAVALIIGAIGYWGTSRQSSELDGVVVTSLARRSHLESDMMHDALRSDVLGVLRAARATIARNIQQVATGTQEASSNIAGVTQADGDTGYAASQMLSATGGKAEVRDQRSGDQ